MNTFVSYKNKVINKISNDFVESNLVYPIGKGYSQVAPLDKDWVHSRLKHQLGHKVKGISNKYVVNVRDLLFYNCDGKYWLLKSPD